MPLTNPFKKPTNHNPKPPISSTLDSSIFPQPLTTYALIRLLLLAQTPYHHNNLSHLQTADIQQLLTELYGYEPSLHWTWIGCTFSPADVKRHLSSLSSSVHHKLGYGQKRALVEFVKKTHVEEGQRKERYLREQGVAAMEAYIEGERRRKEGEITDLERIVGERVRRARGGGV
ncbi:MAG: hypothetical protein Q9188_003930 [Gyalolechia gomerana]